MRDRLVKALRKHTRLSGLIRHTHLSGLIRQEIWAMILITAIRMLCALLGIWSSLADKRIIDGAVNGQQETVFRYALVLIAFLAGSLILETLLDSISQTARARMTNNLRQKLLDAMLRKKYEHISAYHSGELTNRMFSDVGVIVNGIMGIFPALASMITQLIAASYVLIHINWQFTLGLSGVGVLMLIGASLYKKKMKALHKDVQQQEGKVHAILQETLVNMRIVKASGTEGHVTERADQMQQAHFRSQMRRKNYSLMANAALNIAFDASWVYTTIWGCVQIINGSISYGTLVAMMQLVGQIQRPFAGMSELVQSMFGTIASSERLEEIFSLPEEEQVDQKPVQVHAYYENLRGIRFDHVQFSYGRNDVLENLDGTVNKGDFVAITGLSGGGKSTLFLLMLGIYAPTSGGIYALTENGEEALSRRTRGLFAYVPQGNGLFSGTLRENITMFQPNAGEEQIQAAIENACIADFIESLPDKLETTIGEHGLGLSEGQTQRIAIARAILSNAPILLLDEATSALDEETERNVLENISKMNQRTCFIVTHRPAALAICNRKLELENKNGFIRALETEC